MVLGLLLGLLFAPNGTRTSNAGDELSSKVQEVSHLIESEYVEELGGDSIADVLLNAMLVSLDPHSRYLSVSELNKESEVIQGNFDGIGVLLRYEGDTVYVNEVMADGPSAKSGLRPGDCIVKVNNDTVSGVGLSPDQVVSRIRGPHGSKVALTVLRFGSSKPMVYQIRRGLVHTNSVNYSGMLDATTGYVRLSRFAETTGAEFRDALKALKSKGMRSLVLDLRGNGGGLLEAAIEVADEMLERGNLIVYTEGAHQRRVDIKSSRGGIFEQGKLTILIDEYAASASEIVAGAIQDNDRGEIVGRRSFGKGLVQRQFMLADGSALWLTTARYYTPSGRCIQRPYNDGTNEYYMDFLQRIAESPMTEDDEEEGEDLLKWGDSTQYFTKQGRVVYGGGGIGPDRVFPYIMDSATIQYNKLVNSGRPARLAFAYLRKNYETLRLRYTTLTQFENSFAIPDEVMGQMGISSFGDKQRRKLSILMKAYIAQSLFGDEGFYKFYVHIDDDLLRLNSSKTK